jgi:hypothetical protein
MTPPRLSLVVLGAGGQLGHVIAGYLLSAFPDLVFLQARQPTGIYLLDHRLIIIDVLNPRVLLNWIDTLGTVFIINCIGRKMERDGVIPVDLHYLNRDFPRILASHLDAKANGSRFIMDLT